MSRQIILLFHVILLFNITFGAPFSSEESTESVENAGSNESGPDEEKRSVDAHTKKFEVETTTVADDYDDSASNETNQNLYDIEVRLEF